MENQPGETPVSATSLQSDSQTPKPNRKWIMGMALVVLLFVAGGSAFALTRKDSTKDSNHSETAGIDPAVEREGNKNDNGQQGSSTTSGQPSFADQYSSICKNESVSFTSAPLPESQLGYIEPMGKMLDGHVTPTDHVYVHPINSRAADNTYDVVMPANGTIVGISAMPAQYIGDKDQQTAPEDHRLEIMHSCQYYSIFIHVHKLDPAITSVVGKLDPNTSKKVSIELKAGDKVGKIGGSAFDWTLVDTKTTLTGFISPALYTGESWKINSIDPLSVYTGTLKTKLQSLSLRSSEPYGGKIDFDKKGALIGNWFKAGSGGYSSNNKDNGGRYWDGHLSIAPDHIDPSSTIASIGNWQDKAAQFAVKGKIDPSTLTKASGPQKLELLPLRYLLPSGQQWTGNEAFVKGITVSQGGATSGTLLVEVQDGEKLKVEKFIGKSPSSVTGFTAEAQTYER